MALMKGNWMFVKYFYKHSVLLGTLQFQIYVPRQFGIFCFEWSSMRKKCLTNTEQEVGLWCSLSHKNPRSVTYLGLRLHGVLLLQHEGGVLPLYSFFMAALSEYGP